MPQENLGNYVDDTYRDSTIAYLTEHLSQFLRPREHVLICFDDSQFNSLGEMLVRATECCGAHPVTMGEDLRWKSLLKKAFFCKAGTIIGSPLLILGLTKLTRAKATPLYIRNVVTAGYPCPQWIIDGIKMGLDCKTWGILDWNMSNIVAGFSCKAGCGVHLWDEAFTAEILDEHDLPVPAGQVGELFLRRRDDPATRFPMFDRARLERKPCTCGSDAPRLLDISPGKQVDAELFALAEQLLQWTSILDCKINRTPSGLDIELVVFPGEQLPKLPSCARLVVRPWNPEVDVPFDVSVPGLTIM